MDETQARLQVLQVAQQRDPDGDVFATAGRYFDWIGGDPVRQQVFQMANSGLKEGQDVLKEADKALAWVQHGSTKDPKKHESQAAVKGQEPRA